MSWAWDVILPIIPAVDLCTDYLVIGTILMEHGIFGIWNDPLLNLGLGIFLFSQFVVRVGNESATFQRCMACWELFLFFYIFMMGCRFCRLLLAPLDLLLSLGAHAAWTDKKLGKRAKKNRQKPPPPPQQQQDDPAVLVESTKEEEEPEATSTHWFQLLLFRILCKCEFGSVKEYFLSQRWYMQYYQTIASLGGGGRWLVTVYFPWYLDHYDEVQRAEMESRRQAGWTGFCCRNCCCCCCRRGEHNPVVSSVLAVIEEVLQNIGGILISWAILRHEYPNSDLEEEGNSSLRQAAVTRARVSIIFSVISAIFETGYLIGILQRILRDRRERREQPSKQSTSV